MVSFEPPDEQPALLTRAEARGEGWALTGLSLDALMDEQRRARLVHLATAVMPAPRTMINMQNQGRVIE